MCVTVACVFVYSIYLGGVDKIERCVRRISMPLPLGRYLSAISVSAEPHQGQHTPPLQSSVFYSFPHMPACFAHHSHKCD